MLQLSPVDTMQVTCNTCGYSSSIANVQLHSCDIQEQGGRCEDFPACGHTDGDGCQTLASHTKEFYYRNPQFLHEPGSPEWYDAMDDMRDDDEPPAGYDFCKGCGETLPNEMFDGAMRRSRSLSCITCRIRDFVAPQTYPDLPHPRRALRDWLANLQRL